MQLAGLGKKGNLSEVSSLAHALPLFKVLFLLLSTSVWHTSIEYSFGFNIYIRIVTVHSTDSLHWPLS